MYNKYTLTAADFLNFSIHVKNKTQMTFRVCLCLFPMDFQYVSSWNVFEDFKSWIYLYLNIS